MGNAVEMREICVLIFGYLASVDYLKIFGSFAPFVTLIIAFIALKNWQRQDKAKRQAEFLDSLIETAHGLIQEVQGLTLLLETSKIGMKSHELTQPNNVETDTTIRGIIAYVKRHGERDGKRLLERLEISNSLNIKISLLGVKGQIFGFSEFTKCQNAISDLIGQFDLLRMFADFIRLSDLNWDNPSVKISFQKLSEIDPEIVRNTVQHDCEEIFDFAKKAYTKLYT